MNVTKCELIAYSDLNLNDIKDHRQRIPKKIVIRQYLERSIQKKFFSNQSLQIKAIIQEKSSICEHLLLRYM